jgi:alkyl hydroperoxide reductase subunit F
MLDANIKTQLKAYLEKLVSTRSNWSPRSTTAPPRARCAAAGRHRRALRQGHRARNGNDDDASPRSPSAAPARRRACASPAFRWATNSPRWCSRCCRRRPPAQGRAEVIEQIKALPTSFRFETYISLSCHNCPDVVQALNLMAVLNPRISHTMIDGALFQDEVETRQIMAVPTVFLNGEPFGQGRMTIEEILAKLDTGAAAREARKLNAARTPSTCWSSAAARPARRRRSTPRARASAPASSPSASAARCWTPWRSRTSSRCKQPKARKLAAALEQHVKEYEVDIMNLQRAEALIPGRRLAEARLKLENGATLKAQVRHPRHRRALARNERARRAGIRGRAWPIARTATARCSRASAWR